MVFVFGSNTDGRHGAGAALYARNFCGAKNGIGEGMASPTSYALPTVGHTLSRMSFETLKGHIAKFLQFASEHDELQFKVTRVGCERAGFSDAQVAPLFLNAPGNCLFDTGWARALPDARFWGTY